MTGHASFVADGLDRWYAGAAAPIRAELSTKFAERLGGASWLRRLRLRLEIEQEVERRMAEVEKPSPEALF